MKKTVSAILFVMVLFTVSRCRQYDKDLIEYTLSEDETYYVLSYVGENVEELVIPEYYNGKPVLEIGDYACRTRRGMEYNNDSKLKTVKIEAQLKKIGYAAFSGCSFLENINLPQSITEIGEGAFSMSSIKRVMQTPKYSSCGTNLHIRYISSLISSQ